MKNIPPHLAAPAVGFVGAEQAMDDLIKTLQSLLAELAASTDQQIAVKALEAVEVTKAIHVLRHKSMCASHELMTALIQELAAKL